MSSCESTGSNPDPAALEKLHLQESRETLHRTASQVASIASRLRNGRGRMTDQRASITQESICRQEAEEKEKSMEREHQVLQERLTNQSIEAQTLAASVLEQYLEELDNVSSKLAKAQDSAEESEVFIHFSQLRLSEFLTELDKKNNLLHEHESQAVRLGKQIAELNQDLNVRDISQRNLREEILKLEQQIKFAVSKGGIKNYCELMRTLDEVSAKNIKNLVSHVNTKDEDIVRLREEVKLLSSQIEHKTLELEVQLQRKQQDDQELKKKVLKVEFCLQETRSQTRKLLRIAERRERELKELTRKALMRRSDINSTIKSKFWENSRFKYIVSLTVVVLVAFAKH